MTRPIGKGTYPVSCDCGWSGTYDTPGRAAYATRRHSCDRWRARTARSRAHQARMAGIDRTPKPCLHKEAVHQHGTHACYTLDACRCLDCSDAETKYERDRKRQQAYGRWDNYVDAEPARHHVRVLKSRGMGLKRIVAVGGATQGTLWKLIYGKKRPDGSHTPSKRVKKSTAERILATRLDLADGAYIDGLGTTRRIQALVACGWSQRKLSERLGILPGNFTSLVHGRGQVSVATAHRVTDLYEELWTTAPPETTRADKVAASRSRHYAKDRRWLAPMWWDDIDTDPTPDTIADTTSKPDSLDEAAIWRRMHGDRVGLTKAEAAEVIHRLTDQGMSLNEMERRTGLNAHRYTNAGAA